jgi:hypothetical protein
MPSQVLPRFGGPATKASAPAGSSPSISQTVLRGGGVAERRPGDGTPRPLGVGLLALGLGLEERQRARHLAERAAAWSRSSALVAPASQSVRS